MAPALSNQIREDGTLAQDSMAMARGTAMEFTVCTRFNWPWLLMPAALLLAAGIVLVSTILGGLLHRNEHPIWKSSILPVLLHGPGDYQGASEEMKKGGAASLDEIEKESGSVMSLLKCDENRWRFVEVIDNSPKHFP